MKIKKEIFNKLVEELARFEAFRNGYVIPENDEDYQELSNEERKYYEELVSIYKNFLSEFFDNN